MRVNNQVINRWLVFLEVALTIFWILFFLDINLPPSFDSLLKAASYPVILFLIALRWKRVPYPATRDIFLLLFCLFAFSSFFWTAVPAATSNGLRGMLRTFLFASYITARFTPKEQMKLWTWVLSIILVTSLISGLFIPSYGVGDQGWIGIFPYKNYLGYTMSLAIVLYLNHIIYNKIKNNWLALLGIFLACFLIIQAKSSGSFISVLVLMGTMPLYKLVKQYYKLRVILAGFVTILALGIYLLVSTNMETILVDILGEGLTFNGRTEIWELAIKKGSEKPWSGYGFNAFWKSYAGIEIMVNTWSGYREEGFNTHNAFLETFLSLGYTGLFLQIVFSLNLLLRGVITLVTSKAVEIFWLLQLFVFTIVVSLADSYDVTFISMYLALTIGLEWSRQSKLRYLKTEAAT